MYVIGPVISVGVPLMTPVVLSNTRPAESSGVIDHDVMSPPLEIGTMSRTLELLSNSTSLGT